MRMSRCSSKSVNGASEYPDVTAHALCGFIRLEGGFFSFFPQASKISFALSCPVTAQSNLKVFHIASSILKSIIHALTGPFSCRSMPSNAVFYSQSLNLPNKTLTLWSSQQTSTKRKEKWKRVWRHATQPQKTICVFLLRIASMPSIMHPDVWTRVNAENVSIRHV